jgi:hypothetical protein
MKSKMGQPVLKYRFLKSGSRLEEAPIFTIRIICLGFSMLILRIVFEPNGTLSSFQF